MLDLLRHAETRRFARFLIVGTINTLFGYGVFAALITAGLESALALALATIAGVIFNYFTTGKLVFANSGAAMLPFTVPVATGPHPGGTRRLVVRVTNELPVDGPTQRVL